MKETGHNTRVWRMQDAIQEYEVNKTQYMSMKEVRHNTWVWRKQDTIHEHEGSKKQYMSNEYEGSKTQYKRMKETRHNTREWSKQDTINMYEGSRSQYKSMHKQDAIQKSMREARRNTVQFTVVWRQQDELHKLSIVWRKQDRIQEYEGISLEEAAECILYSIFSLLRTDFGSFFFFPKLMLL